MEKWSELIWLGANNDTFFYFIALSDEVFFTEIVVKWITLLGVAKVVNRFFNCF